MASVTYGRSAFLDLDRLTSFLDETDSELGREAASLIVEAIRMLQRHPLVGRPTEEGLRELVISRGRSGYLALYEYPEDEDRVVVLAVRPQRAGGYPDPLVN